MTRAAGRDLDALVAVRVMELTPCDRYSHSPADAGLLTDGQGFFAVPYYSTQIGAAWEVLEKLRADGLTMMQSVNHGEAGWWCVLYPHAGPPAETAYAETAPLSICWAALEFVGLSPETTR